MNLWLKLQHLFSRRFQARCGHRTYRRDRIQAYGYSTIVTLRTEHETTPYCHRCLEAMTALCPICHSSIFIGEPVRIVVPLREDFEVQEGMRTFDIDQNHIKMVACLRCADTIALISGIWVPPGVVQLIESPLEHAWRTGQPTVAEIYYH